MSRSSRGRDGRLFALVVAVLIVAFLALAFTALVKWAMADVPPGKLYSNAPITYHYVTPQHRISDEPLLARVTEAEMAARCNNKSGECEDPVSTPWITMQHPDAPTTWAPQELSQAQPVVTSAPAQMMPPIVTAANLRHMTYTHYSRSRHPGIDCAIPEYAVTDACADTGTDIPKDPAEVPEPSTWLMLSIGLLGLAFSRRYAIRARKYGDVIVGVLLGVGLITIGVI